MRLATRPTARTYASSHRLRETQHLSTTAPAISSLENRSYAVVKMPLVRRA